MRYTKVGWRHNNSNEPVILYSELDQGSWEVRKVEIYADGRVGFASKDIEYGGAGLGLVPVPPISEIAADPEFDPLEISAEEFEEIWRRAVDQGGDELGKKDS